MNSGPNRPNSFLRAHLFGFPVPGAAESSSTFTLLFSALSPPGGLHHDPSRLPRHVTVPLLACQVGVAAAPHFILLVFAAELSGTPPSPA